MLTSIRAKDNKGKKKCENKKGKQSRGKREDIKRKDGQIEPRRPLFVSSASTFFIEILPFLLSSIFEHFH